MPELTDEQFRSAQNLEAFVRRGLADPKTRRKILEVQKHLHPDTAIPEIDESDPLHLKLQALEQRLDDRDNAEHTRNLSQTWNAGRERARKRGFADEGIAKLEKFMEQKGIFSHDDAMVLWEHEHPPPIPAQGSSGNWNFFTPPPDAPPDLKLLYEGREDEWLAQAIPDTLARVRNGG